MMREPAEGPHARRRQRGDPEVPLGQGPRRRDHHEGREGLEGQLSSPTRSRRSSTTPRNRRSCSRRTRSSARSSSASSRRTSGSRPSTTSSRSSKPSPLGSGGRRAAARFVCGGRERSMAIDNMYGRRRLGPPLGVRMALSIPPSVLFPTLGFLYMAFSTTCRPRPALLYVFAPITALGSTEGHGPLGHARPPRHAPLDGRSQRNLHGHWLAVREAGSEALTGIRRPPRAFSQEAGLYFPGRAFGRRILPSHTHWHALDDGRIQCDVCPRACKLQRRPARVVLRARPRAATQIVLTTYGRSSGFCVDPIEKKPLNHFLPGTSVLSFGTAGCNLACRFCQNWDISQVAARSTRSPTRRRPRRSRAAAVRARVPQRRVHLQRPDDLPRVRDRRRRRVPRGRRPDGRGHRRLHLRRAARASSIAHMDAANVDLKALHRGLLPRTSCGAPAAAGARDARVSATTRPRCGSRSRRC